MDKHVTYVIPETGEWLRLTLGACSAVDLARFRKSLREGKDWTWETLQYDFESPPDEMPGEDVLVAADAAWNRSYMLAACKRVERATLNEGETEPTNWRESELPDAWQTVAGFVNEMPVLLYDTWRALALAWNPGVFFLNGSDAEKKRGVVFASR